MYQFNFAIKPKRTNNGTHKTSNIVEKNVIGIVNISLTGFYYVVSGEKEYFLSNNSYNVKDKTILFSQKLTNNRVLKVVNLAKNSQEKIAYYLPFGVGCVLKGNAIIENGRIVFDLIKVVEDDYIYKEEQIKARKFFVDNYEEIEQIIINKNVGDTR